MPHNKDNVPQKWSREKELFPGVFEKVKFDPQTGRWDSVIYKKGGSAHFHGWIDPKRGQAGGEIHPDRR